MRRALICRMSRPKYDIKKIMIMCVSDRSSVMKCCEFGQQTEELNTG